MGWDEVPVIPVVTMNCPPYSVYSQHQPPTFTASSENASEIIFTVTNENNEIVQQSLPKTENPATFTPSKDFPAGIYSVCVIAVMNDISSVPISCSWTVVIPECNQPDSSPYVDFNIHQYRCCDGEWKEALCHMNAIILLARTGNLSQWQDLLQNCEWKRDENCNDIYPFISTSYPIEDLYYVSISNNCGTSDHAVVGKLINPALGVTIFSNWNFIQWGDLNIQKGDYQLPYGCGSNVTTIEIKKVNSISVIDCNISVTFDDPVVTFLIDNLGDVTIR